MHGIHVHEAVLQPKKRRAAVLFTMLRKRLGWRRDYFAERNPCLFHGYCSPSTGESLRAGTYFIVWKPFKIKEERRDKLKKRALISVFYKEKIF